MIRRWPTVGQSPADSWSSDRNGPDRPPMSHAEVGARDLLRSAGMKQQVVILGGGFGGLRAAWALKSAPVEVTLIDRRN